MSKYCNEFSLSMDVFFFVLNVHMMLSNQLLFWFHSKSKDDHAYCSFTDKTPLWTDDTNIDGISDENQDKDFLSSTKEQMRIKIKISSHLPTSYLALFLLSVFMKIWSLPLSRLPVLSPPRSLLQIMQEFY